MPSLIVYICFIMASMLDGSSRCCCIMRADDEVTMPWLIRIQFVAMLGALFWVAAFALPAAGQQQITVTAPMQGASDGFFEGVSIGFGASGKGWFFNNGLGPVAPQFGGFDPNAGANFGFGINFPGGSGFFNLSAAAGFFARIFVGLAQRNDDRRRHGLHCRGHAAAVCDWSGAGRWRKRRRIRTGDWRLGRNGRRTIRRAFGGNQQYRCRSNGIG